MLKINQHPKFGVTFCTRVLLNFKLILDFPNLFRIVHTQVHFTLLINSARVFDAILRKPIPQILLAAANKRIINRRHHFQIRQLLEDLFLDETKLVVVQKDVSQSRMLIKSVRFDPFQLIVRQVEGFEFF